MAYPSKLLPTLAGSLAVLGVVVAAPTALATDTDPNRAPVVDTNTGFGSSDSRGGGLFGESSNPMDLLHRAVLMNETSLSDFSRQNQGRMTTEADRFRSLQQEAMRQQSPGTLEVEATEPAEPGPF
ncbi:MAG: hypothetical protein EA342_12855 [Leptolyngbya sp. LCM1.Bin17]|nr:MAG: hypothetical protein EA342_12855 [Leptolyngbya sp. LCM1.Bin17]